jgi:hypothetical protein
MRVQLKPAESEYRMLGSCSQEGLYVDSKNEFYAIVTENGGRDEVFLIPTQEMEQQGFKTCIKKTFRNYKRLKSLKDVTIS